MGEVQFPLGFRSAKNTNSINYQTLEVTTALASASGSNLQLVSSAQEGLRGSPLFIHHMETREATRDISSCAVLHVHCCTVHTVTYIPSKRQLPLVPLSPPRLASLQ